MPMPALAWPNPGASQRTPRKRAGVRFAPALPGFAGCADGDAAGGGSSRRLAEQTGMELVVGELMREGALARGRLWMLAG